MAARADPVRKQGRLEAALAELDGAGPRLLRPSPTTPGSAASPICAGPSPLNGAITPRRGRSTRAASLSGLALADGPAEASLLSNLAIVAEYEEDYERAQELNEQALELARAGSATAGGSGRPDNNLGMIAHLRHDYVAARAQLEEALRIELEVGDSGMVAIVRHSLGTATRELGDTAVARQNYADALGTYGIIGDKWAQCLLYEDIAMLCVDQDPLAALRLVGAAEAMREAIGSPRVPAQEAELDDRLRSVRDRLGSAAAGEHAAGRPSARIFAYNLALHLCDADRKRG